MCTIESKINYSPKFSFDCLIAQDKFKRRKNFPERKSGINYIIFHLEFSLEEYIFGWEHSFLASENLIYPDKFRQ